MIIKIDNIPYTAIFVDSSLEASAGDGASVATALNQLPEVLSDNTCYIMRRNTEDKKYVLKEQSLEFVNLAILGMPKSTDDKYYNVVPQEARSAWEADISPYAYVEATHNNENVSDTSHNFIKTSSINHFTLLNCYISRSENQYLCSYNFPNIIYLNNSLAIINISGCRFGYRGVTPDIESWRKEPVLPQGDNTYKYQKRCTGYVEIENSKEVYINNNTIIEWMGSDENEGYDSFRSRCCAIYHKSGEILDIESNKIYHMSSNTNSMQFLHNQEYVDKLRIINNEAYFVCGASNNNWKDTNIFNLNKIHNSYICGNKISYLKLNLPTEALNKGYFLYSSIMCNITFNYNIADCGETKISTPGMLSIDNLYDGFAGKLTPQINGNTIKGYNQYPAETGSTAGIFIRHIYSKEVNTDNLTQYSETLRVISKTIVENCDIQCFYGKSIYNEKGIIIRNSSISGKIDIKECASIDLDSYKNYMSNTTGIIINGSDNYIHIKDFWVDKESVNYPYTGTTQISNSPQNANAIYIDKSNCKIANFSLDSSSYIRSQNVSYICPNMEQDGHYWQSTGGITCESWNVNRVGSKSSACLKLANNKQENSAYELIIGNAPFKGFEIPTTQTGTKQLEVYMAYKNFSSPIQEETIREHVIIEALVPYKTANNKICYKSVFSNVSGILQEDMQSEWQNDTDLKKKVIKMPLDITLENEPVEVRIYYSWYDASGFCYIDTDIKIA